MAPANRPWTLTIPSDLRLLPLARGFVQAVCEHAGFERAVTDAVVLAMHEAANNAIRHAHHGDAAAQIQIQCRLGSDGIEILILDEGDPFDLAAVPDLDPAELRIGGRGVFLMRTLMDELTCQPRGRCGNTLRMIKRCSAAQAAPRSA